MQTPTSRREFRRQHAAQQFEKFKLVPLLEKREGHYAMSYVSEGMAKTLGKLINHMVIGEVIIPVYQVQP